MVSRTICRWHKNNKLVCFFLSYAFLSILLLFFIAFLSLFLQAAVDCFDTKNPALRRNTAFRRPDVTSREINNDLTRAIVRSGSNLTSCYFRTGTHTTTGSSRCVCRTMGVESFDVEYNILCSWHFASIASNSFSDCEFTLLECVIARLAFWQWQLWKISWKGQRENLPEMSAKRTYNAFRYRKALRKKQWTAFLSMFTGSHTSTRP